MATRADRVGLEASSDTNPTFPEYQQAHVRVRHDIPRVRLMTCPTPITFKIDCGRTRPGISVRCPIQPGIIMVKREWPIFRRKNKVSRYVGHAAVTHCNPPSWRTCRRHALQPAVVSDMPPSHTATPCYPDVCVTCVNYQARPWQPH